MGIPTESPTAGSPTKDIGITKIGQIAINAYDVGRATAFYRDILGLRLLFTAGHRFYTSPFPI